MKSNVKFKNFNRVILHVVNLTTCMIIIEECVVL